MLVGFCAAASLVVCPTVAEDRIPWTSSRVTGSPDPPKPYHIERVYPNLQFQNPVELRSMPGADRMLLLQVNGKLFAFDDDPDCGEAELILDVGAGLEKMRAFGFGLHPNFETNRELFLVYSTDIRNVDHAARLSRFRVPAAAPFQIDRSSEEVLVTWTSGGHTGSTVHFDNKGMLYFSAGDGSRPFPPDEFNVGQDLSDIRATICRIDVDHSDGDKPYRIPDDNPFIDVAGARPEIWAYGFRNPWRFTIDRPTGRLLCGDVGWELWESVFDVKRGGNYGWSIFEGPGALRGDVSPGPTPIDKPLTAYTHSQGQSITGGLVYRGNELPDLKGGYLYGDYVSGLLWGLRHDGADVTWNPVIAETGIPIITFGQSTAGEALVVSYSGEIYKLVNNPLAGRQNSFPKKLSETGLFERIESDGRLVTAPGVYQYSIAAESFQPGISKQYHLALPDDQTITVAKLKRQWKFPTGTVFARTFSRHAGDGLNARPMHLETQLLHFNGMSWQPHSYLWDRSQADAELIDSAGGSHAMDHFGVHVDGDASDAWHIHSGAQCRSCHTIQAGGAVGFSLENLSDRDIDRFVDIGVLDQAAPKWWNIRKLVRPSDQDAELGARARSYLAANCAHCHRRGGGGSVALDLEYSNLNEAINAISVAPTQGNFQIDDAQVIAPGAPFHSVLLYRMSTSGIGRMPKLSHVDPDPDGLRLVRDWIKSLSVDSVATSDSDTSRSLQTLLSVIETGDRERGAKAARTAREQGDVMAEGLFEPFLPSSERRDQLGPNIDPGQILTLKGDVSRGEKWLTESRGSQCIACHRVGGQGRNVGPRFDLIGSKRTPAELLASVLDPSAEIDEKFQTVAVLTEDGTIVTGLNTKESKTRLGIRSADGKDHVIVKDTIQSRRTQQQSLMPSGLAESMTARELADLIAYLSSLR